MTATLQLTTDQMSVILSSIIVGFCWGFTLPLIRKTLKKPESGSLFQRQIQPYLNPLFLCSMLLNQCGSVLFYYLLRDNLTATVPISNSAALVWQFVAELTLGTNPSKLTCLAIGMILVGMFITNYHVFG